MWQTGRVHLINIAGQGNCLLLTDRLTPGGSSSKNILFDPMGLSLSLVNVATVPNVQAESLLAAEIERQSVLSAKLLHYIVLGQAWREEAGCLYGPAIHPDYPRAQYVVNRGPFHPLQSSATHRPLLQAVATLKQRGLLHSLNDTTNAEDRNQAIAARVDPSALGDELSRLGMEFYWAGLAGHAALCPVLLTNEGALVIGGDTLFPDANQADQKYVPFFEKIAGDIQQVQWVFDGRHAEHQIWELHSDQHWMRREVQTDPFEPIDTAMSFEPYPQLALQAAGGFVIGQRETQQDHYAFFTVEDTLVAIVADGHGVHGETVGKLATKLVTDYVTTALASDKRTDYIQVLQEAFHHTEDHIMAELIRRGGDQDVNSDGGTVLAVALIKDNRLYRAHVGDSCIYLVGTDTITQLSKDHSFFGYGRFGEARLAMSRVIGDAYCKEHDPSNLLSAVPDWDVHVLSGEQVLLCSDGLCNEMGSDKIHHYLTQGENAETKIAALLTQCSGHLDNTTALLIAPMEL